MTINELFFQSQKMIEEFYIGEVNIGFEEWSFVVLAGKKRKALR